MKPTLARHLAGALLFSIAVPAVSQSTLPPVELDPIIVTATRSPERLQNTIGDNSVLERAQLDQTPDATLAEVLGRQRGITFVTRGGPQSLSTINMRGTASTQSLVLIDGMRVNSPGNGLPVLNAIPTNAIERIEIVRGAASSVYGADAIGGVINIITRKPSGESFDAYTSAGIGTYATSQFTAGLSGSANGWAYSLYGGYGQSGGFSATNADIGSNTFNPDNDSYYRSNLGGQLAYTWMPGQTLSVQTTQSRVNAGYDAYYFVSPDTPFNDRGIQTLGNTIISSQNQINQYWLSTLSGSFLSEKYEFQNLGLQAYNQSDQYQYQWINSLALTPDQTLTLGVERLEQSVKGAFGGVSIDFPTSKIHTNAVMATYTGRWGIHHVQASARNDDNAQYGNFVTGSLGYAIDFARGWQARASMNNAFRAPTFNELYYPNFGNPNLSPEKSRNVEIGLRYAHLSGEVALTGFYNQIQDLIVSVQESNYVPTNIQQATIRGVSLWAEQSIGANTTVGGSFDFLSPYNNSTGQLLPFIAQRVLKLNAAHRMGDLSMTADWMLTSSRRDGQNNMLGGYALVNVGATYALNEHIDLQVRWNNVLGKNYTLVKGYNNPGSNVFFNVTLRQ